MATIIPITSLHPESTPPLDKTIRAVVSLYWPYSSSTKQCALLLTDPDPRLRSRRGQVRVRFTSATAAAVAHGKVGIGDEVLLDLRGVQWANDGLRVSTPGKSIEGELVYRGDLSLRIVKKAGSRERIDQHISVSVSTPPPEEESNANQTPVRSRKVSSLRNSLGDVDLVPIYSSPAFIRRQKLSEEELMKGATYNPFADIDQDLDSEQPRKRQRISDVIFWRFAGRSPSPPKQMPIERTSNRTKASTTTQQDAQQTVDQIRSDTQQSEGTQRRDTADIVNRSEEQSPTSEEERDALRASLTLPVKLSPLPPALPGFGLQDRKLPANMLPPPVPKLDMPEDPFLARPETAQNDPHVTSEEPATPKLKAVPGYTLPLPSPFPQEPAQSPFQSDIAAAAQDAREEKEAGVSQSTNSEDSSDDGVRLMIKPTVAAFATQHRQDRPAQEADFFKTTEATLQDSARQIGTDSTLNQQPEDVNGRSLQATATRAPRKPRPASRQTEVYPDPRESGSDTEEDEVVHNMYSRQAQSHARNMLEREGVKIRDWVHRDDAAEVIEDADVAEVIEDMGETPEISSDEDSDEHEDDESNEDDEMLSVQGEEQHAEYTLVEEPESMDISRSADVSINEDAALGVVEDDDDDDERLIDIPSRSQPKETRFAAEEGQHAELDPPLRSPSTHDNSPQVTAEGKAQSVNAPRSTNNSAQVVEPVVLSGAPEASCVPPKTPSKTLRSLFGFGFDMDGASETPPRPEKPTPQSEKDRIMKKTYSSLFGFRESPSPEREAPPISQDLDTLIPTGTVQRESSNVALQSSAHQAGPEQAVNRALDTQHTSPRPGDATTRLERPYTSLTQNDIMHVVRSEMPAQGPQAANEERQEEPESTQPNDHSTTVSRDVFGSLEVQLSDASDAEAQNHERFASISKPLVTSESPSTPSVVMETIDAVPPVNSAAAQELRDASPTAATSPQVESQISVQTDAPFDDKALVASMLNEAASLPGTPAPMDEVTALEYPESSSLPVIPVVTRVESGTPSQPDDKWTTLPASTAPERSLGTQEVGAPYTSTAPRPSQIEVIDLGSSDESSDEDEADQDDNEPAPSQLDQASTSVSHEIIADAVESDDQAYSPTEVVSSPAIADVDNVEMQDVASDTGPALEDAPEGQVRHLPSQDIPMSNAQDGNSFADELQAGDFPARGSEAENPQPQSQISETSSTWSTTITEHHNYFSAQSNAFDNSSFDEEDEAGSADLSMSMPQPQSKGLVGTTSAKEVLSADAPQSTAQSEVEDLLSLPQAETSPSVPNASEVNVARSSERSQSHALHHQVQDSNATSQVLASSSEHLLMPETRSKDIAVAANPILASDERERIQRKVQTGASTSVEDSMKHSRQPGSQQSSHVKLLSPGSSQPRSQTKAAETQHRGESQPFETQLPMLLPADHISPPTSGVTNEGLELAADGPMDVKGPTPATPRGTHKRNASSQEQTGPVRRSARNAKAQDELEDDGPTTATRLRTVLQRHSSPEAPQVTAARQTRSQRTASPERRSNAPSFDSSLDSPESAKSLRRSARKSKARTESFDYIEEEAAAAEAVTGVRLSEKSTRRPAKNPESQSQPVPGAKRKSTEEEENSPPHKRPASARQSRAETSTPRQAPLTKSAAHSSRKSFTSRLGHVPEAISAWFSPRRSTRQQSEEDQTEVDNTMHEKAELLHRTSSNGLVTSSAYYTPLSNIEEKLNPSSQPGVDNTIDVLAIVADDTKAPERAKGGPRDYFTTFKIVDSSLEKAQTSTIRVEVFRPWHATLPVAQTGDVVLLRGFAVKSRQRQPYLISTDVSAWLVWRFGEAEAANRPGSAGGSRRVRRGSVVGVGVGVREETKGPPVELGDEERQRARELRAWWQRSSLSVAEGEKEGAK